MKHNPIIGTGPARAFVLFRSGGWSISSILVSIAGRTRTSRTTWRASADGAALPGGAAPPCDHERRFVSTPPQSPEDLPDPLRGRGPSFPGTHNVRVSTGSGRIRNRRLQRRGAPEGLRRTLVPGLRELHVCSQRRVPQVRHLRKHDRLFLRRPEQEGEAKKKTGYRIAVTRGKGADAEPLRWSRRPRFAPLRRAPGCDA